MLPLLHIQVRAILPKRLIQRKLLPIRIPPRAITHIDTAVTKPIPIIPLTHLLIENPPDPVINLTVPHITIRDLQLLINPLVSHHFLIVNPDAILLIGVRQKIPLPGYPDPNPVHPVPVHPREPLHPGPVHRSRAPLKENLNEIPM
jgi:hypothetical protein